MKTDPILIDLPSELNTARLHLRVPCPEDGFTVVGPLVRASLAELQQWMPWATEPYDELAAEIFCRTAAAHFLLRREVQFLVFDQSDYVGNIGLHRIDWTIRACEIGYWLGTPFVGRGYMSEALAAVTAFAFDTVKAVRVEVRTDAKNARSRRVAERCGFALEGTLRNCRLDTAGEPHDGCIYARTQ